LRLQLYDYLCPILENHRMRLAITGI
jgi:hypothetical protein